MIYVFGAAIMSNQITSDPPSESYELCSLKIKKSLEILHVNEEKCILTFFFLLMDDLILPLTKMR